jgi:hypothetical protein
MLSKIGGLVQLHWRFLWKDIIVGDQHVATICKTPPIPSWDTDNLARSLVSIYNEMFKDEDFTSQRPVGCSQLSPFPRWTRKAEELNLNLRENVTPNFSCQNHSILLELRPISLP